jgi:hypothetical protein
MCQARFTRVRILDMRRLIALLVAVALLSPGCGGDGDATTAEIPGAPTRRR